MNDPSKSDELTDGETVRVSIGTAGILGLADVAQTDLPTTAYLMVGGQCARDCAFCAQARSSIARSNALSRVIWPPQDIGQTFSRIATAFEEGRLQRACFQVTAAPGALATAIEQARSLSACRIPLSASVAARDLSDVERLLDAGAQRVGLALDAATPAIYRSVKGGDWHGARDLLFAASERFPKRLSTHLIVGLGETDAELFPLFQQLSDHGITIGLFAFTPVPGTRLASQPQPSLITYRRAQAARFLIASRLVRAEDMAFDSQGRVVDWGLKAGEIHAMLTNGEAFRTSGCPGCNRPYYNERPGGIMYNYPRALSSEEARMALAQVFGQ